jgi:hypothetical protein
LFVSPETRFHANDSKATYRPSVEMAGSKLSAFASPPPEASEIRVIVRVTRSRTKMSQSKASSPGTSVYEFDENATYRPSAEIDGSSLSPFDCTPPSLTDSSVVMPVIVSWTKMSGSPFVSPGTRLFAPDMNATYRPFDEMELSTLPPSPSPCWPEDETETRVVAPVVMSWTNTS